MRPDIGSSKDLKAAIINYIQGINGKYDDTDSTNNQNREIETIKRIEILELKSPTIKIKIC